MCKEFIEVLSGGACEGNRLEQRRRLSKERQAEVKSQVPWVLGM